MQIFFINNNVVQTLNSFNDNNKYVVIVIHHNIIYGYNDNINCYYRLVYNNQNHKYIKFFNIYYDSGYQINKNKNTFVYFKKRFFIIQSIIYNFFYSYFIYNKYYNYINTKDYYNMKTINHLKLFNCRDYYKIYSFIC